MVVTRFAPSPTGDLHIGSVRTALYCWLYAKHTQGTFILRIEDTDRERSTAAAEAIIHEGMGWLGLSSDKPVIYQTARFERYRAAIEQLMQAGLAYRCHCSTARLAELRETQMANKQKPKYDGHCLTHSPADMNAPHVIRFKQPTSGQTVVQDLILGEVVFNNQELDDLIIQRTDGTPTYNFCVAVDDWDMGMTHVIRGNDHLNNTPRQMNILKALGAEMPQYAHIPMILGPDGKKLSKRHGACSVLAYRDAGYLPEALLNYLVRLGWSAQDEEILSISQMIDLFDVKDVGRSAAIFDEDKLKWLNQHYMKTLPAAQVLPALSQCYQKAKIDITDGPALPEVLSLYAPRCKTLVEIVEETRFLFEETVDRQPSDYDKHITEAAKERLSYMYQACSDVDWTVEAIKATVDACLAHYGVKLGHLAPPLRVMLTGKAQSPSIAQTIHLLGREKTLARLKMI